MKPVILIFGYGNLSRGDDALAPLLLENIEAKIDDKQVEILTDFQLQIEHALDLEERQLVLFIDASVACEHAFDLCELQPNKDNSYTTHAMSPASVLQVYQSIKKAVPPPCFLLSIQGLSFELGESLTSQAQQNLQQALEFTEQLLEHPELKYWQAQVSHRA
ncbi:MAG: hydrogenase maturation protease [Planctomycetaceae bacterium]|nr:hydrogenase maturation protease [Planctomycetaceae bacterium]